jgi:hypothetical protein
MVRYAVALVSILTIIGCTPSVETKANADGSKSTVVRNTNGEKSTITQKGDKAEFSDNKGNAVVVGGDKAPELGVEVMPGLELEKGSVIAAKTDDSSSAVAMFKTEKSVDDVAAFYRAKLGSGVSESKAASNGAETATFTKEDGNKTISIVIVKGQSDPKTTVNISYNEKLK